MKILEILLKPFTRLMDLFPYWDWCFLISLLVLLTYAALRIKKEKKSYLEHDFYWQKIGPYLFKFPQWWGIVKTRERKEEQFSTNQFTIRRADMDLDWKLSLTLTPPRNRTAILKKGQALTLLNQLVQSKKIHFDPENLIEQNCIEFFHYHESKKEIFEFHRYEGMATHEDERRYIDLMVVVFKNPKKPTLIVESISGVLHGMVEGPYVESCVSRLKILEEVESSNRLPSKGKLSELTH